MLMIKVLTNQHVVIKDDISRYTLRLLVSQRNGASLELCGNKHGEPVAVRRLALLLNQQKTLLPDVELLLRRTGDGEALLGFDAPRRIKIHGSWQNEPSQCRTQLSSLSDKELVVHTEQLGKTDLEIELAKRLQARSGVL